MSQKKINKYPISEGFLLESVAVLIPIYKEFDQLSFFELFSLNRCFEILSGYTIIFFCPKHLNVTNYQNNYWNFRIKVERFDDFFFIDVRSYNALMLNESFYLRFLKFEYILIYQLDAFVFEDQLIDWCTKGYDYIGAPWITDKVYGNGIKPIYKKWKAKISYSKNFKYKKRPVKEQFYNKVGNGGFSLRRVKKFLEIIEGMQEMISYYLSRSEDYVYNEDAFWGLEVNRDIKRLNIPDYNIAIYFSMEFNPELGFKMTNGTFPFGCHDWDRYLYFWKEKFIEKGLSI